MYALTRPPSPTLSSGERTHLPRVPIAHAGALEQHRAYCQMLRDCGVQVHTLDAEPDFPDATFVEDTAIVLDEVAVLASMGVAARRGEVEAVARKLAEVREVVKIELPARIDGGDVLCLGRTLLVGLSSRTNVAGTLALESLMRRFGYRVWPVPVHNCLHLKTACTALPDGTLLVNEAWLDTSALRAYEMLPVPGTEPFAANVLLIGETVCAAAEQVQTAELIRRRGFTVHTTPLSEFAKAEGGVTCLSLLYA